MFFRSNVVKKADEYFGRKSDMGTGFAFDAVQGLSFGGETAEKWRFLRIYRLE